MVITGSVIMVGPGSDIIVEEMLRGFPQVTFHGKSDSGMDLIINIEADNHYELESLCQEIKDTIPEVIDIAHVYINFEDEIEKIESGTWHNYYRLND